MPSKKFTIPVAIAYVNGVPHLGHAMEFIEADAIARYKRLMGFDVFLSMGTDEYGMKQYNTARKKGLEPQALADLHSAVYRGLKETLSLSFDDFIRTTDKERHWPAAQKLWKRLKEAGDLYQDDYEGLYCEGCEAFLTETDLLDGQCPTHLKPPAPLKEKNYFFRLSKYSDRIVQLIETGALMLYPDFRKHEFLNMAKEGLKDVSFSRPKTVLPWGVPVPDDPDQVMYVWCDALTNYLSVLDYGTEGERYHQYWPADLHVIGKDIVRFHAGIWVGMLLSAGIEPPKGIFIHGFVGHNGRKMSKTLGNVVDPIETVKSHGVDALRYYLLREIPVGRDGDFNDELFIERYNTELANNLGNLVNRVHTLAALHRITDFTFNQGHALYQETVNRIWKEYVAAMDRFNLHEGVKKAWELVDFANKRMEEEKPWSLIQTEPERGRATLCNLLEILRHISILIHPFIPDASERIRLQLGLPPSIDPEAEKGWGALKQWKSVGEGGILFPRKDTSDE